MAAMPPGSLRVPGSEELVEVHSIPCKTTYSGPALVSSYFSPEAEGETLKASFRGRALRGSRVPLPEGFSGLHAAPPLNVFLRNESLLSILFLPPLSASLYSAPAELPLLGPIAEGMVCAGPRPLFPCHLLPPLSSCRPRRAEAAALANGAALMQRCLRRVCRQIPQRRCARPVQGRAARGSEAVRLVDLLEPRHGTPQQRRGPPDPRVARPFQGAARNHSQEWLTMMAIEAAELSGRGVRNPALGDTRGCSVCS
jgi:hypothetical protein